MRELDGSVAAKARIPSMGIASRVVRAVETALFGDYTGTTDAAAEHVRRTMRAKGCEIDDAAAQRTVEQAMRPQQG